MNLSTASDGTVWCSIDPGAPTTGRILQQNILKEVPGPTPLAKRYISDDQVASAYSLLVDEAMLRHIVLCTEYEAQRRLDDKSWSMTRDELDAFIAILYARGAYSSSGMCIKDLWNSTWGPPFFAQTMSRTRFYEICVSYALTLGPPEATGWLLTSLLWRLILGTVSSITVSCVTNRETI